jgi:arginyl-tRNA synthetase
VTPDDLVAVISDALHTAIRSGHLSAEVPDEIRVERPRHPGHGDYSTNVALRLARCAGLPARTVAEKLAPLLSGAAGVARAEAAGPGFVNITLETAALGSVARDIVLAGDSYGRTDRLGGLRIDLEFVSANPTGPVHIGGARWAVVGDVLARLLEAAGAEVTREYYFNDAPSIRRRVHAPVRGDDDHHAVPLGGGPRERATGQQDLVVRGRETPAQSP